MILIWMSFFFQSDTWTRMITISVFIGVGILFEPVGANCKQLKRDMESRENLPKEESSEVLAKYKISQMQILDSYSPMYEFED